MKFMKSVAVLAMAAATANAGNINWVLEGEAPTTGPEAAYWGFLIKADTLPVQVGDPIPDDGQFTVGGTPLLQWNGTHLVLADGAGQIAAIAMLNAYDFYTKYEVDGFGKEGPHPSIEIGKTSVNDSSEVNDPIPVYNKREFNGFENLTQWNPDEGMYYMIMFDLEGGRYAIAESLQMSEGPNGEVRYNDMTTETDGFHLDPFFPISEDEIDWFELTLTPEAAEAALAAGGSGLFSAASMAPLGGWAKYTSIPEPMTTTLVALGCVMFGLRRRVRRG